MTPLALHEFHQRQNARFAEVNGAEVVAAYGDVLEEYAALRERAGVLDLGFRGRLCLTGVDRVRFLNGQVTNNVKDLRPGEGCYAALVTAKGRLESDLNIYSLPEELLLDFEPGLGGDIAARFEKFIIADDVQVVEVAPHYGLLSVQGPQAARVLARLGFGGEPPALPMKFATVQEPSFGEIYVMNRPRSRATGFDLFIPASVQEAVAEKLLAAVREEGGRPCGWRALEMVRIEAGIPRFGQDMDGTNLAPETGIEDRAISYSKGCYIGQEVIARIRTYGQVARALRGLQLPDELPELPQRGDKLFWEGKEVGFVTSALASPAWRRNIALGYVRRECFEPGTGLLMRGAQGDVPVQIVPLPFFGVAEGGGLPERSPPGS